MPRSRRLVVIPSDPIEAYEKAGYGALERYYNPQRLFDEVYALSPFETGDRQAHGMSIRRVAANRFREAIEELQPAVVRAYGGHWPSDLACRNRVPGVPVLVSVHDTNRAILHRSVRYADLVLCVSKAVEDLVASRGVERARIRSLPNRVDLQVFRPAADDPLGAELSGRFPPGRHILHVGRQSRQKNQDTLIAALALLPGEYQAVFVGRGDTGPYASLARRFGVFRRCHWVEAVRNCDLAAWYSWCDCMCTPSRWEGFGIVFIEAAACGAAIVTSNLAPMNEYLVHGTSAHLVDDYESPQALAQAMREVCENDEYRHRLAAGARQAAQPFDRDRIDALEAGIYREALKLAPRVLTAPQRVAMAWDAALRRLKRAPAGLVRRAAAALGRAATSAGDTPVAPADSSAASDTGPGAFVSMEAPGPPGISPTPITGPTAERSLESPAISVVLPTHNGGRYLDEAVASVVAQTCVDWELILVDDASTDDTPAKLDAWAARDPRIRAVHLAANRKLPGALNDGFRHARGELLAWTSDDNAYLPEALQRMREVLATRPELDVVYADATLVDASGAAIGLEPARPPEDLAVGNCVGPCFLYRRRVHEALGGYDEGLFLAEDYDFWLRASLEFRLEPLRTPLYLYRRHGQSLSAQRAHAISLATETAVERWLGRAKDLPRRMRGRAHEALGLRALLRGDVPAGRRHLLRATWLLGRPPWFRRCRSYMVDFLLGAAAGNRLRTWLGRPPKHASSEPQS